MSDRVMSLAIAAAVLLVVGTLLYRANMPSETASAPQVEAAAEPIVARSTQVKARMLECDRMQDGRILGRGEILNIGNADLHYVTVKVLWSNEVGLVAEANEIIVLRDEVLAPGDAKTFSNVTASTTAARCNVETVDWW